MRTTSDTFNLDFFQIVSYCLVFRLGFWTVPFLSDVKDGRKTFAIIPPPPHLINPFVINQRSYHKTGTDAECNLTCI